MWDCVPSIWLESTASFRTYMSRSIKRVDPQICSSLKASLEAEGMVFWLDGPGADALLERRIPSEESVLRSSAG